MRHSRVTNAQRDGRSEDDRGLDARVVQQLGIREYREGEYQADKPELQNRKRYE